MLPLLWNLPPQDNTEKLSLRDVKGGDGQTLLAGGNGRGIVAISESQTPRADAIAGQQSEPCTRADTSLNEQEGLLLVQIAASHTRQGSWKRGKRVFIDAVKIDFELAIGRHFAPVLHELCELEIKWRSMFCERQMGQAMAQWTKIIDEELDAHAKLGIFEPGSSKESDLEPMWATLR